MKQLAEIFAATLLTLMTTTAFGQMNPNAFHYVECHSDQGIIAKAIVGDAVISTSGNVRGWLVTNLLNPTVVGCSPAVRNRLRGLLTRDDGTVEPLRAERQIQTSAELCAGNHSMALHVFSTDILSSLNLICRSVVSTQLEPVDLDKLMLQIARIDTSSKSPPLIVSSEQYLKLKAQLPWITVPRP